jgi:hypothetical protein
MQGALWVQHLVGIKADDLGITATMIFNAALIPR